MSGFVLGLAMTALGASAAQAQATFYTVTYVEASPKDTRQATALLKSYVAAGKKDDGNVSFELVKGIRPADLVRRGRRVEGPEGVRDPRRRRAQQGHERKDQDACRGAERHPPAHRACRSRRRKSGKAGVCAVTHVDVIPPQRENGTAAVKQLAEDSRKHAGNIRFDVLVQTNRPNHFTVVECWKDRKAFDAARRGRRKPRRSATSWSA